MAQTHSLDLESSSSQYASISDASQTGLDLTTALTIEAWIKLESYPSGGVDMPIVFKWNPSTNQRGYRFAFVETSGSYRLNLGVSSDGSATVDANGTTFTSTQFPLGVWHHVAVTWDAGAYIFYINGKTYGTGTTSVTSLFNSSEPFRVGNVENTRYFDGLIKDVRVFNDVRTASEIVSDAHTQNVSDANLKAEWNFNNSYADTSGNGNTLTASGSPVFSTDIPWEGGTQVSGNQVATSGLHYWTLDESSGNAADQIGAATLTNSNVTYTTGKRSNCALFDSSSDKLAGTVSDPDSYTSGYSWAFWAYVDNPSTGSTQVLAQIVESASWGTCIAQIGSTGELQFKFGNGQVGYYYTGTGQTVPTATWFHVVMTVSGTLQQLFYNGVLISVAVKSNSMQNNSTTLTLGEQTDGNFHTNGRIDEFFIVGRALHYGDVLELYNGGSGLAYVAGYDPLVAAQGSFTLTGQTATFFHNRYLNAAQGSYSLSGQTTALKANRHITLANGSFTLTGYDALFQKAFHLAANQGSFTLSGQAAALQAARRLSAAQGSYTLTGEDASLARLYTLIASQGSYSLTGEDADLLVSRILTASHGTFTITGQDAALSHDYRLTAGLASFVLTGFDAQLILTGWQTIQKSRRHSWTEIAPDNTPTPVSFTATSRRAHSFDAPENPNVPTPTSWMTMDKS